MPTTAKNNVSSSEKLRRTSTRLAVLSGICVVVLMFLSNPLHLWNGSVSFLGQFLKLNGDVFVDLLVALTRGSWLAVMAAVQPALALGLFYAAVILLLLAVWTRAASWQHTD